MFRNSTRAIAAASFYLLLLGIFQLALWPRRQVEAEANPSQIIVRVGDQVITVKDLDQIIRSYPPGSISSRESKRRLVESLITNKLFALAARSAKLDAAEDYPKARKKARENGLIYVYFARVVAPKFSDEAARKVFQANRDEYGNFSFFRGKIVSMMRDQVLTEMNQSLSQQWEVKRKDDLLRDLDLQRAPDPSLVVAEVGSKLVTVDDLRELSLQYQNRDFSTFENKKHLLDVLVVDRLYLLAAEKAGLANDPGVQKFIQSYQDRILAMRYIPLVERKVTLEDARRYYRAHAEEFKGPDQLLLRQIVVSTEHQAQSVKARLDRGDSFADVAKSSSTDRGSAEKGGLIGWVRKGRLHPEVEKVAFQLKPKQVSRPIKTPVGYVIVRLDERLTGVLKPFDQIAANLLRRLKTNAVDAERKRLMKTYNITINEKLL